ncbi:hypothetical protein TH44_04600 [Thalassospira xiamenensis]|uniref:Uncharacterized protein n=1 Tax=Thalassospira xiamenensis TaxID=220697 RepID=A0A367XII2_9PROT|nr:hypothetical protein TH44_04600 [Thalassospira xiamenensis]
MIMPHYQYDFDNVPGREIALAGFLLAFKSFLSGFDSILHEAVAIVFQRIIDIVSLYHLFPRSVS